MAIKQNNFYRRWCEAAKADKTAAHADLRHRLLLPGLLAAACLIAWGAITAHTALLNRRTDAINEWCQAPANQDPYTVSLDNQLLAQRCRDAAATAQDVWDLLNTYPDVTGSSLSRIQGVGSAGITVVFRSYNAATGQLLFDAQSVAVIDIPAYIRSLQSTGLFQNVDYTGYGFNAAGAYTINFVCTLAAPGEGGQA